ncbi:arsenate reductase family protein [Parvularcula sp. BGMRC 0090]|uniref:Arsenate reductase n=1 Tax=Parvularcula maris TaxID=2965077 RepID=A0A9X2RHT5_9PROT|nr:arsenate reductase family protein [Parvularcula maris]
MIVIHHNKNCGTSRRVLAAIEEAGHEPLVVDYLAEGWTRPQLMALFAAAGLTPSEAMRKKRSPAEELGLLEEGVTDEQILDAMLEHPSLVERPLVASPKGVRLCRPAETVDELL